jgi:HAD superfamily hydrolase (TIGR01509 family)
MSVKCIIFDLFNVLYPFSPEAEQLVETLKGKNIELAAISSMAPSKVKEITDHYGIENVLSSWSLGLHKTQPEIYLKMLTQVEFKGHQCIMIDDQLERLAAAKQTGIKTVWLNLKNENPESGADYVINNVSKLLDLAIF